MTAAAERLRKKVEDECYDWLAVAGVHEKEDDSASLCFRMRLIKTREAVRALRNISGLMRLQCRTTSSISSNPPHQVNSAPQTCLLCMACRENDKRHPPRHILTAASGTAGETSLSTLAKVFFFFFYLTCLSHSWEENCAPVR